MIATREGVRVAGAIQGLDPHALSVCGLRYSARKYTKILERSLTWDLKTNSTKSSTTSKIP